eukprot:TRINITY_DN11746_c0_g1_i1.p1 TRINITY_DN11746_c0_g1~~TRINITY_DN11746_c0_g1_i1.p1  ORF type:complete len:112 (+),score=13.99 TRINITY_DN11746_c0_g1_i1:285-620(+)
MTQVHDDYQEQIQDYVNHADYHNFLDDTEAYDSEEERNARETTDINYRLADRLEVIREPLKNKLEELEGVRDQLSDIDTEACRTTIVRARQVLYWLPKVAPDHRRCIVSTT